MPDFYHKVADVRDAITEEQGLRYIEQVGNWAQSGQNQTAKGNKNHRLPTMWYIVALDRQLRISCGQGLEARQLASGMLEHSQEDPKHPRPGILTRWACV